MEISTRVNLPIDKLESVKIDPLEEGRKLSESSLGSIDDAMTSLPDDAVKVEISSEAIDLLRLKKMAAPALDEINNAKVTRFPKLIDSGNYNMAAESTAKLDFKGSFKRRG